MGQKAYICAILIFLLSLTLTYLPESEGGILRCYDTEFACQKGDPNRRNQELNCKKWCRTREAGSGNCIYYPPNSKNPTDAVVREYCKFGWVCSCVMSSRWYQ